MSQIHLGGSILKSPAKPHLSCKGLKGMNQGAILNLLSLGWQRFDATFFLFLVNSVLKHAPPVSSALQR